jgi:hypothetical protein
MLVRYKSSALFLDIFTRCSGCSSTSIAAAIYASLKFNSRSQAIGCLVSIRGPPPHPAFEFQTITQFDILNTASPTSTNDDIILRCCIQLQVKARP